MWLKVFFASSSWCLQCAILAFTGDTHLVLQTLQLIRLLSIIRWLFCCVDSIVCRGGWGWIVLDPCFVMQCFFSSSGIISAKKR